MLLIEDTLMDVEEHFVLVSQSSDLESQLIFVKRLWPKQGVNLRPHIISSKTPVAKTVDD